MIHYVNVNRYLLFSADYDPRSRPPPGGSHQWPR